MRNPPLLCVATVVLALLNATTGSSHTPGAYGLDLDHDELSDIFAQLFPSATTPGDDQDGDGQSNAQEAVAGTDPTDALSILNFSAIDQALNHLQARWSSVPGKRYQLQMSPDLTGSSWSNEGNAMIGTGGEISGQCPINGERMFLRLNVADTDSDGDGVTDWEEIQAGTNPGDNDTDHDGLFDDWATLSQLLTGQNTVTVHASDALASEAGPDSATFRLVRRGGLNPLIVSFTLGGTAVHPDDYTATPAASAFFPLGVSTAVVTVTPAVDAEIEGAETVTLTLNAGAAYSVGTQNVASVSIEDPATSVGSGLRGSYYDNGSSTYSNSANFNPNDLRATRLDPEINFLWDAAAGRPDRPHPSLVDADYHSVRWIGQIQPQFSETFTFYTQANNGSKLWIDGQLLIDVFDGSASSQERSATIALEAGRRYDLKLEFQDQTGTSHMYLRWASPSVAKQIVPSQRLHPETAATPQITSPLFAIGIIGGPFSYTITGSNGPTSFGADGLPDGLSVDPASGEIAGTPTGPAGLHFATITAATASGTATAPLALILLGTGGGLSRDVWTGLTGTSLQALPLHTMPATTETLTQFEAPADAGDDFGDRLRGYITAPASGNFTFFLTTEDENAELWISASDDPARRLKRSFVLNGAPQGSWSGQQTQKSLPMKLVAGQQYYVEALRKESGGSDRLSVGWIRPGQPDGSVPSEIVPGYCLSPYAPPPPPPGQQGSLYIATLTPQGDSGTLGSGSSVMTVNVEQTEAVITVQWSNLTGPKTQLHVHDASRANAIIFDFDTETPDASGAFHWTFAPTGEHTIEDIRAAISTGQTYVNVHTARNSPGEIKGFLLPATGSRSFVPPPAPPELPPAPITTNDAARFLNQATFGLSGADLDANGMLDAIEEVQSLGYAAWIDEQMDELQTPATLLQPQVTQFYIDFPRSPDAGNQQSANEIWRFWWKTAMTAPDQLRHRVAFALSQILVVSENGVLDENTTAVTAYHDILARNAFGSFRILLGDVTLNYGMGRYLDMAGNRKPDPNTGRTANENYAREIMQLFSIGLRRLHPDGTVVFGHDGLPVATYDQDIIVALANNFTGWNYNPATPEPFYRWRYTTPMTLRPNDHFTGEKSFLDGTVITARNDAPSDLRDSHDVLCQHPSVAPFISRQLIQRLVTANPSPGYIYRVAQKFDDDGTGARGNLTAVIKAILLDYEARSEAIAQQPGFGHLREPVLRATHVLRALHGRSMSAGKPLSTSGGSSVYSLNPAFDGNNRQQTVPRYLPLVAAAMNPGWDIGTINSFSQTPLRAATVFNFFEPDYVFPGQTGNAGLFGPEFQITSETTIINIANWYYNLIRAGQGNATNWDNEPWLSDPVANPPTAIDVNGVIYRYNATTVLGMAYPETPRADTEGPDIQLDLTLEKTLAYAPNGTDTTDPLLDHLNLLLMSGQMEKSTSSANPNIYYSIWNYVRGLPRRVAGVSGATAQNESDDRIGRVRDAIQLIVTSPEFNIQK
ncbi:MAG: DUF1800 family protein [Verrucomicrobiales bacterium]